MIYFCQIFLLVVPLLQTNVQRLLVCSAQPSYIHIDTDNAKIFFKINNVAYTISGKAEQGNFTGQNNKTWTYDKVVFEIEPEHKSLFERRIDNVTVSGSRAVELNAMQDLVLNNTLDLDGRIVEGMTKRRFLGGFLANMTSCCYVGAGPGGAFTFHGGAHGGNGGGAWKDLNNAVYYGYSYDDYQALIGGSTGAVVYDSNPGSGGGAIAITVNGKLTIESGVQIRANGYTVKNTSYPACAGGSAGGKIVIKAKEVSVNGALEVQGGSSGMSSNYSYYCGDGGGGGVIYVNAYHVSVETRLFKVDGGKGLEYGRSGRIVLGANFLTGNVTINTSTCELRSTDIPGVLNGSISSAYIAESVLPSLWSVCTFRFSPRLHLSDRVKVTISGNRSLAFEVSGGNIDVMTDLVVSGNRNCLSFRDKMCLGGYTSIGNPSGPGMSTLSAAHGNTTRTLSYGVNPVLLIGGSTCSGHGLACGGGAIELKAPNGTITIGASIVADAWSANSTRGASGGTIRIQSNGVLFTKEARLSAAGVSDTNCVGDGGVIEINVPINNYKRPRMDISGGTQGWRGTIWDPLNPKPDVVDKNVFSTVASTPSISAPFQVAGTPKLNATVAVMQTLAAGPATDIRLSPSIHATSASSSVTITSTITTGVQVNPGELTSEFKDLAKVKIEAGNVNSVLKQMKNALKVTRNLSQADVQLTLDLLKTIANRSHYQPKTKNESESTVMLMVECSLQMMSAKAEERVVESKTEKLYEDIPMACIAILEDFGRNAAQTVDMNDPLYVHYQNIEMKVEVVKTNRKNDVVIQPQAPNVAFAEDDKISIPSDVIAAVQGRVTVPVISIILNGTNLYTLSQTTEQQLVKLGSLVMSVTIDAKLNVPLVKPIRLQFKLTHQVDSDSKTGCGFWSAASSNMSFRGWSYEGCTSRREGNIIKASCNHMTSFAVLVQVAKYQIAEEHIIALNLITYIGSGISLFGLLLTFGTFISLETLACEKTAIHTNLVVALGIAQIIFLAGVEATHNKAACTAVAILLHYFFTAAFAWMFAEGLHLYNKVVSVFTQGSRLKFYYILGWGLPVVIVAVSAGIRPDGYGRRDACWISIDDGLIWAFVVPVLLVIAINVVVLISVVKILMASVANVNSEEHKRLLQVKSSIKAIGILMPILGMTWIFGILAVNRRTLPLQYIFCVLNAFQGFFIFLIHCIGNSEVRAAFKRLHEKHTLSKSIGEKSSGNRQNSGSVIVRRQLGTPSEASLTGNDSPTLHKASTDEISLHSLHCPDIRFKR